MIWFHRIFQKPPPAVPLADDLAAIKMAAEGLLYPSETDAPFFPFKWPATAGLTAREAVESHARGEAIESLPLEAFFTSLSDTEDAARYAHLRDVMTRQLPTWEVFRTGKVKIAIYLIGQTRTGEWIGLQTESVET